MKEGQYNRIDQDNFNDAENQYFANIKHDKDLTWDRIEEKLKKKKIIPLWIYYAAASILLIFCLSVIYDHSLNSKNKEIAELKSKFEIQNKAKTSIESVKYQYVKSDTVKVMQERIVQIPVSFHDTLVVYDTVPTILVQKDTIIIKEKGHGIINEQKVLVSNKKIENQKIVSANTKDKRKKRFIIRFGKPKTETSTSEEPWLITLRTK